MTFLFCLFSIFLFTKGCNDSNSENTTIKSAQDDISIVYEASTRGFYQKIQLNKKEIVISKDRNGNIVLTKNCSAKDWDEVVALLDKIDSEKIKETNSNPFIASILQNVEITSDGDSVVFSSKTRDVNIMNLFFQ